jgi:hypothetical protein
MKSKKQQDKQKYLTLVKEHRFKRSEGNRLSVRHMATTTINIEENIVNLTSNSHLKDVMLLNYHIELN